MADSPRRKISRTDENLEGEFDYIPNKAFRKWQTRIDNRFHLTTKFIVGAKGVGKTSLLNALFKYVKTKDKRCNVYFYIDASQPTEEEYASLLKSMQSGVEGFLIMDNIQLLPSSPAALLSLKRMLKEKGSYKNWFIVCASSRQGLKEVEHGIGISRDEIERNMYVLNPDEKAAADLYDKLVAVVTGTPEAWKNADHKKELLDYIGYLPGCIITCFDLVDLEQSLPELKTFLKQNVVTMIRQEHSMVAGQANQTLYYRVLAILAKGSLVDLFKIGLSPAVFSWTLMKSSDKDVFQVSAISPMVTEAVQHYIMEDDKAFMYHLQARCDIVMDGETEGSLMEKMVLKSLKHLPSIRYFRFHTTESKSSEYVEGQLLLDGMDEDITEVRDSTMSSIFTGNPKKCMYYLPNAKGFDFVIFDQNGESHAIQVSKQKWQTKCRTLFLTESKPTYKYILTTQEPTATLLKGLPSSAFKAALTENQLRVMSPDFINKDYFREFCSRLI